MGGSPVCSLGLRQQHPSPECGRNGAQSSALEPALPPKFENHQWRAGLPTADPSDQLSSIQNPLTPSKQTRSRHVSSPREQTAVGRRCSRPSGPTSDSSDGSAAQLHASVSAFHVGFDGLRRLASSLPVSPHHGPPSWPFLGCVLLVVAWDRAPVPSQPTVLLSGSYPPTKCSHLSLVIGSAFWRPPGSDKPCH